MFQCFRNFYHESDSRNSERNGSKHNLKIRYEMFAKYYM